MGAYPRERARGRIARLANRGLDVDAFFREAGAAIRAAVPSYAVPGWFTLDPTSLLITSYHNDVHPEIEHELLVWEYLQEDVNKAADGHVRRGGSPRCTRRRTATRRAATRTPASSGSGWNRRCGSRSGTGRARPGAC